MLKKHAVLFSALIAGAILVACASHAGTGAFVPNGPLTLPGFGPDLAVTAILPKDTVGEDLPSAGLGTLKSEFWEATLGGFTQTKYSQQLAFPPGTKITLRNLSRTIPHTLNVIAEIKHAPANFPNNPNLKTSPWGKGILAVGYRSGILKPNHTVTITLSKAGIYLIGCAYHYHEGLRDIIEVKKGAKPGLQATPPPKATSSPSTKPSPSPTCRGYGC
jgi:plastocyanin